MNKKMIFIGLLGALFLIAGLYLNVTDPNTSHLSFQYFGFGTWIAGIVFFALYPKYKEIISFLLGLLVLHAGVLTIMKYQSSHWGILGFLVFTSGIIILLGSGFSDYLKRLKKK